MTDYKQADRKAATLAENSDISEPSDLVVSNEGGTNQQIPAKRSGGPASSRRGFLKGTTALTAAGAAYWLGPKLMFGGKAIADVLPATQLLSDPELQPKFVELAPNALDPAFKFIPQGRRYGWTKDDYWDHDLRDDERDDDGWDDDRDDTQGRRYKVKLKQVVQQTGLVDTNQLKLDTTVWGYGSVGRKGPPVSWPGPTFEVNSTSAGGGKNTEVKWVNKLPNAHLLPVDERLHWCFSIHGIGSANGVDYRDFSIAENGVPAVPHLHGGKTDFQYDGLPEFFWTPKINGVRVTGPQWDPDLVPGGFTDKFVYNNDVTAGNLWYHDHALGITRLNVYAGLAGFYFVRDENDTGKTNNPLGLPAERYELAYAIQDRMFTETGALFYPALDDLNGLLPEDPDYMGDPGYADFIYGEGVGVAPAKPFEFDKPSILTEFFGDHMVVNGKIWPKTNVERHNYRMHLLNGCDSRFLVVQFVDAGAASDLPETVDPNATPLKFWVIGSDQGLGTPMETDTLIIEPGGRYDIVIDFSALPGRRVIMKNIGKDAPFNGNFGRIDNDPDLFPDSQTDRIMAFDVAVRRSRRRDKFDVAKLPGYQGVNGYNPTTRRVALFEGRDEFNRLQPLLGTVGDDLLGNEDTGAATAFSWFQDTTETPALNSTEIWEIYNFTADAHPIHLHLVNFEILSRQRFTYEVDDTMMQTVPQHDGSSGTAPIIRNIVLLDGPAGDVDTAGYFDTAPKDLVTALPGDPEPEAGFPTGVVTRIKARFDKPGRYVWHCHILSHEDHEMMRVMQVVDEPKKPRHKRHHEHAKTRPGKWKGRNRNRKYKRNGKKRDD